MPIGIGDECAERVEPLKATGIVMRQAAGISQANSRRCPLVRRIVVNGSQAEYGDTTPNSDAVKSAALEEIVRVSVDDARRRRGHTSSGDDIQRECFKHQEIAPPSGNSITGTAASGKLDQHVMAVNEGPELRAFTAGG